MNSVIQSFMGSMNAHKSAKATPGKQGASQAFQQLLTNVQSSSKSIQLKGMKVKEKESLQSLLKQLQSLLKESGITFVDKEGVKLTPEQLMKKLKDQLMANDQKGTDQAMNLLESLKLQISKTSTDSLGSQSDLVQLIDNVTIAVEALKDSEQTFLAGMMDAPFLKAIEASQGKSDESKAAIEKQLKEIWNKFQQLMKPMESTAKSPDSEKMDQKALLALKDVLNQFTKLSDQLPLESKKQWQNLVAQISKDGTNRQQKLFQDLLLSFKTRQQLPNTYHQQNPVSSKDIAKWVAQSLEQNKAKEQTISKGTPNMQTVPMTKVEQYVIHVNQTDSASSRQKQFIQEFERVLQSSRMQFNQAGSREMLLKLRPANLGDMTVKFAQIDGEMTVKILVSTQAAKEMLEGNMSKLRHMFSPQQVIVEKNESLSSQSQIYQESEMEEGTDEEKHDGHNNREQDQREDGDEQEQLSFQEILMNEKV